MRFRVRACMTSRIRVLALRCETLQRLFFELNTAAKLVVKMWELVFRLARFRLRVREFVAMVELGSDSGCSELELSESKGPL